MKNIRNTEDLRDAYSFMLFVERTGEGPGIAAWVKEMKQNIRAYVHKESDRRLVHDDCYGAVLLINVPEEVETPEEAEEWFDAEERIGYIDRGYDCTGQQFTGWHHIGVLGGKMVCWRRIDYDV